MLGCTQNPSLFKFFTKPYPATRTTCCSNFGNVSPKRTTTARNFPSSAALRAQRQHCAATPPTTLWCPAPPDVVATTFSNRARASNGNKVHPLRVILSNQPGYQAPHSGNMVFDTSKRHKNVTQPGHKLHGNMCATQQSP